MSNDKGPSVINSYQETEKQIMSASKGFQGQQKIKMNSSNIHG